MTISAAIRQWLGVVKRTSAAKTVKSYESGLIKFELALKARGKDPEKISIEKLQDKWILFLIEDLTDFSPWTIDLYLSATRSFYAYAALHEWAKVSRAKVTAYMKANRPRNNGKRQARIDLEAHTKVLNTIRDYQKGLRNLRDRALIFSLATTGLRISEALELNVGDIDFAKKISLIVGQGQ